MKFRNIFLSWVLLPSLYGGDWQGVNEWMWNQNLGSGLVVGFHSEARWTEDISRMSYYEIEPMLTWRYSPRWDFGLSYERDEQLYPMEEISHSVAPSATVKWRLPRFPMGLESEIRSRSRVDFMVSEDEAVDWRPIYRHRLEWGSEWKWGSLKLKPYFFNESFLDVNQGEFTKNRLGAGLGFPLLPPIEFKIFGMRLDEKIGGGWTWHPVVGVAVEVSF